MVAAVVLADYEVVTLGPKWDTSLNFAGLSEEYQQMGFAAHHCMVAYRTAGLELADYQRQGVLQRLVQQTRKVWYPGSQPFDPSQYLVG